MCVCACVRVCVCVCALGRDSGLSLGECLDLGEFRVWGWASFGLGLCEFWVLGLGEFRVWAWANLGFGLGRISGSRRGRV